MAGFKITTPYGPFEIADENGDGTVTEVYARNFYIGDNIDDGYVNPLSLIPDNVGTNNGFVMNSSLRKFPLSISSGTATDVGEASPNEGAYKHGYQDADYGYVSGASDNLIRFPFSITSGTGTNIGSIQGSGTDLSRYWRGDNHSDPLNGYGFRAAGYGYPFAGPIPGSPFNQMKDISKFPFSNPTAASIDVGELINFKSRGPSNGISSTTDAYAAHGGDNYTADTNIEKFPFSIASGSSTDVGQCGPSKIDGGTYNSETDGYSQGRYNISKFPFSISGTTATQIADFNPLPNAGKTYRTAGCVSGLSAGFHGLAGVGSPWPTSYTDIRKTPYAQTSGSYSDVGELGEGGTYGAAIND